MQEVNKGKNIFSLDVKKILLKEKRAQEQLVKKIRK